MLFRSYEAHPTEAVLNGEPDDMLELYGYLYDYNAALSAVPQGWRLPTDDDWKKLEKALGISDAELDNTEWRGNYAGELIRQKEGGSGLSFIYSGYYTGSSTSYTSKFRLLGISGYYWSSTSDESRTGDAYIFYRKITYNSSQICRYSSIKDNRFSVRCEIGRAHV